jgi:glycosyltransferase involved in cell wall biosynthesis
MSKPLISIVVPIYKEEGNLELLHKTISETLSEVNFELVLVNDGSPDNSLNVIKSLAQIDSRVKYLSFSRNFGHQAALRAGLKYATGDAVVSIDADLQQPPVLIHDMIEKWKEGYDVVYTIRESDKEKLSYFKYVSSKLFYKLINFLSYVKIDSGAADFRLLDRKVVDKINSLKESDIFFRGIIPWIGFNQTFIQYDVKDRQWGESSYTFSKMMNLAISGVTSFSTKPLIYSIHIGLIVSTLSFLYGFYALFIKFFTTSAISGWTSLIISVLFIGGVQLICLGVIGQYIAKIYDQVRERPAYIINEKKL